MAEEQAMGCTAQQPKNQPASPKIKPAVLNYPVKDAQRHQGDLSPRLHSPVLCVLLLAPTEILEAED